MIYPDSQFVRIGWDEDLRCVTMEWKGVYAEGEEYRRILTQVLDLILEKGATRLLADGRKMKVITTDDQVWLENTWMPRSIQVGLKHSALIVPASALAQLSVGRVMTKFTSNMPVTDWTRAYFDNTEDARAWLRSCPTGGRSSSLPDRLTSPASQHFR